MMAAATINIRIICYFLANIGILENCEYEIICHRNIMYTLCVLALIFIMLDLPRVVQCVLKPAHN